MASRSPSDGWIGVSLPRKEDARFLLGHGKYIADLRMPGMQDVAFVRSQVANGRVRQVIKPDGYSANVFTLADLGPLTILEAGPELPQHKHSPYPPLADDRVRYVGQPIAACLQPTRALAEDLADRVTVDLEQLPAVVDCVAAMRAGQSARVRSLGGQRLHHQHRGRRQSAVARLGAGARAPAVPDEPAGDRVARMPRRAGLLGSPAQRARRLSLDPGRAGEAASGLSRILGLPENQVRVIAPDVGGGFGGKNRLMPEDVAVAAIALKVGHPVRWIEDRREHLLASVHARDHYYDLTLSADKDGTLLGVEGDIYIDAGAYALWPTGAFQEASMASRNLTGPYRIRHLNLKTYTVATNKAPMGPYRGVARPGACFAIERLVDEMARELGREPFDLRRQNIVTAAELPYDTAAGMRLDTGDYVAALDTARDMIDLSAVRKRQAAGEAGWPRHRRRLCVLYRAERPRHGGIRQAEIPRDPGLRVRPTRACCRTAP